MVRFLSLAPNKVISVGPQWWGAWLSNALLVARRWPRGQLMVDSPISEEVVKKTDVRSSQSALSLLITCVCFLLQKVCNFLEIGRQQIGDWSAISRRLKPVPGLFPTPATGRRSVGNQSATSSQPVGDHQKPFYDRFGRREISLAATKTSLRPNRPCILLQPVADQSPT